MLKVLNKKIYIILALLILRPLHFIAVELQEIKNIFFAEHFSMTTSNSTLEQSILVQPKISPRLKFLSFIFVKQLNLYVHKLINFTHFSMLNNRYLMTYFYRNPQEFERYYLSLAQMRTKNAYFSQYQFSRTLFNNNDCF